MKNKFIFAAAAALMVAAACSTTDDFTSRQEITFQVARHSQVTKVDTTDYKTNYSNVPFGAYAWYKGVNASDNTTFMVNQAVAYDSTHDRWAPSGTTYYWPKSGTIDFICYSPYTADGISAPAPIISEDGIKYPAWDVNANPDVDVMYADKVTGLSGNSTTYYYNGVPVLFHHALAKVSFQIKAAYLEKTADTGDKTRWEITVNSITVSDILTTGSLELSLNPDGSWAKPANGVWTADPSATTDLNLDVSNLTALTTGTQNLDSNIYVLPQMLDGGQGVTMNVTIKTYRDQNDGNGEKLVLTETGVDIPALLSGGSLNSWGINQNVTYVFNITPSLGSGTGVDLDGDGIEDMEPTVVYFDPAVEDWQNITVNAGINI